MKLIKFKFKLDRVVVVFWMILLLLSVLSLVSLVRLEDAVAAEDAASKDTAALVLLGATMKSGSDYLTAEARNFVVTGNMAHLHNYWQEVLVTRSRDQAVASLKQYPLAQRSVYLLSQSKRNSDALIRSEKYAMALVLRAYEVSSAVYPAPLRQFRLTDRDKSMTPLQQVARAQTVIFDRQYDQDKDKIMAPIRLFQHQVLSSATVVHAAALKLIRHRFMTVYALAILLLISIIAIVWMRVLLLKKA